MIIDFIYTCLQLATYLDSVSHNKEGSPNGRPFPGDAVNAWKKDKDLESTSGLM